MKYQFDLTCRACPEQYDVMDGHHIVAYVRYRHGCLTVNPVLPKRETRRWTPDGRERTEQVYDFGTHIISETLGDPWDGRLPDHQRQAILQRIDRAVSHYWQHPFRRAQDGQPHPIDPKTGDYTDEYHDPTDEEPAERKPDDQRKEIGELVNR